MPAEIQLLSAERIVYSRAWGAFVDDDIREHTTKIAALFRDGTLDGDWAQIVDFSAAEHMDGISTAAVRRAAEENPWPRYTVRAFVVSTDEQFGLARMYQAIGNPKTDDLAITHSLEEARAFVARERVRLGIAT